MRTVLGLTALCVALALPAWAAATTLKPIPSGSYRPLFPGKGEPETRPVKAFRLDQHPVSEGDFADFVQANPKWRRDRVKALFTDEGYLRHWPSDDKPAAALRSSAVVHVSFFAAKAFCKWRGRRLPTTAEWEYVGAASETARNGRDDPAYNQKILDWYGRPNNDAVPAVKRGKPNVFGVYDMHGLVWEWTSDFNSVLVTGESRGDAALERGLFCGSGAIGAADPSDYAAFMRTAFRSSLDGRYTGKGLGFRCAADK